MQNYQKTVLPSGLTVISEFVPHVRSIAVGVWIKSAARMETPENNGVAHFLEHMMFKGTDTRNAREIMRTIESLGGNINAYTSKEQTTYHIEMLDDHLSQAITILADMLNRTDFDPIEFAKEKNVILDEILSVDEMPEDVIQDYFMEKLFPKHGLGYPILGTEDSVKRLTITDLMAFYNDHYTYENTLVTVSGNVNHQQLVDLAAKEFQLSDRKTHVLAYKPNGYGSGNFILEKPIQQAHLCIGAPAVNYGHRQKYDLLILNTVLGGGMGARLFQNIREAHGIAYGIYSFLDFFIDDGMFGVYLGTDQVNLDKSVDLLAKEFTDLREMSVTSTELSEAKSQIKGGMVLGLESNTAKMSRLAMLEIYFQKFISLNEVIAKLDAVTVSGIKEMANQILAKENLLQVSFLPEN